MDIKLSRLLAQVSLTVSLRFELALESGASPALSLYAVQLPTDRPAEKAYHARLSVAEIPMSVLQPAFMMDKRAERTWSFASCTKVLWCRRMPAPHAAGHARGAAIQAHKCTTQIMLETFSVPIKHVATQTEKARDALHARHAIDLGKRGCRTIPQATLPQEHWLFDRRCV